MPAPTMQISVRDEARSPSESSSIGSPQTGSFLTCFSGIELSFRCARAGERSGLSLELVRWICPQAVCRTGSLRQEFAGENDRGGIRIQTTRPAKNDGSAASAASALHGPEADLGALVDGLSPEERERLRALLDRGK